MSAAPRVAVVGAGAVGCYYGGMLARAGDADRPAAHVAAMRLGSAQARRQMLERLLRWRRRRRPAR